METLNEELFHRLEALRQGTKATDEIYQTIHLFGRMNFQEARPEVERFLTNESPELRLIALLVLTQHWHLAEHWQTARHFLEQDPDRECRMTGAAALKALKRNTQDRRTLAVLARVVRNERENHLVRQAAYAAMRGILQYDPREQLRLAAHNIDLEREVDWKMVDAYLDSNNASG